MPDEHQLSLRQIDRARGDPYADELDFVKAQLARIPTRNELVRLALCVTFATATLVVVWMDMLWR